MDLKISVTLYFSQSTPPVHTQSAACLRFVFATVNIPLSFYLQLQEYMILMVLYSYNMGWQTVKVKGLNSKGGSLL